MSDIVLSVSKNNLESIEKEGRELYKHNKTYQNIANCLEHPEFRKLFDEHFKDMNSLKTILMFLKMYESVEKMSPVELSPYQKLAIMDNMIKDSEIRQEIVKNVITFTKSSQQVNAIL